VDQAFQAWRVQFCEDFISCMPRELREMTYDCLLESEYIVQVKANYKGYPDVQLIPDDVSLSSWMKTSIQQSVAKLARHNIVGRSFSDELVHAFYRRSTFDVIHTSMLRFVFNNSLFGDSVPHGVYPCGLRIHVWNHRQPDTQKEALQSQEKCLHTFLRGCSQNRLTVEIILHPQTIEMCKRFLTNMAPLIYQLKNTELQLRLVRRQAQIPAENAPLVSYFCAAFRNGPEYDMSPMFEQSEQDCLAAIAAARFHVCIPILATVLPVLTCL
jgi:hypothetical protein